ncbi:hypothetical protein H106_09022 [Trichophyton rubrum CBS 735.88]|nr:hypothetical protein H106_09022 [Trichophyton rubrum CBS 735.88]
MSAPRPPYSQLPSTSRQEPANYGVCVLYVLSSSSVTLANTDQAWTPSGPISLVTRNGATIVITHIHFIHKPPPVGEKRHSPPFRLFLSKRGISHAGRFLFWLKKLSTISDATSHTSAIHPYSK